MDHTTTIDNLNKTLTKLSQTILARFISISSAQGYIHMGAIEMIHGVRCGGEQQVAVVPRVQLQL